MRDIEALLASSQERVSGRARVLVRGGSVLVEGVESPFSLMNASDAIIWHIEQDPLLQSTIMAVWALDAEPTPERMRESAMRMMTSIDRLHQRVDLGVLDPEEFSLDFDELRVSAGFLFGISFPVPLTFSFGFPLREGEGDDLQVFEFEIGF